MRDVFCKRDACGRIENRHQERDRVEQNDTMRGTTIIMVLSMTNLTDNVPQKEDTMKEGSRLSHTT
jgi:hypothetical protein